MCQSSPSISSESSCIQYQEQLTRMNTEILRLETENRQLNDTLKWMHDTIWELLHSQKNSSQCEAAAARIDSFT